MKMKMSYLLIGFLSVSLMVGCSGNSATTEEAKPPQNDQETTEQIVSNIETFSELQKAAADYLKSGKLETMSTKEVYEKVLLEKDSNYIVVDVRSVDAFAAGNIEGSVNIPYANTADPNQIANLPKDKKLIVVCFSGHTASQTAALWNLMGYDAIAMINGMGGWTSDTALGVPIGSKPFNFEVVTDVTEAGQTFTLPTIDGDYADVSTAMLDRAKAYLESGQGPVVSAKALHDALAGGNNFYLVDIRDSEVYNKGHVKGAINLPYQDIMADDSLQQLPIDQKIVLIGYDGHIASQVARILNQLGYEAYAMKDGMRVWTDNEDINGVLPISAEKIYNYPTKVLNVDLNGETGAASCS